VGKIETEIGDSMVQTLERFDYDGLWKDMIKRFFWQMLEMVLLELYRDADTNKEPEFLDKEFRDILNTADPSIHTSPHYADYVIKVPLKNGGEEWLILHVEVQQGKGGGDLNFRMYHYKSLIFAHYMKDPVALAIITGKRPESEAKHYSHIHYGTESLYRYNRLTLMDLKDEELLASNNPIALAFYAAKVASQSKEELQKYTYLRTLTELLADRGWNMNDKRDLMLFLERIINLRDAQLRRQYREYQQKLNEEGKIVYVSVMDEYYLEKAREEAKQEMAKEIAKNLLADGISPDIIAKNAGLSLKQVHSLKN